MRKTLTTLTTLTLALTVAGCTETPQTVVKKVDAPAWQGAANAYVAEGWKVGDASSWQAQMKSRAAGQDEHVRIQGAN